MLHHEPQVQCLQQSAWCVCYTSWQLTDCFYRSWTYTFHTDVVDRCQLLYILQVLQQPVRHRLPYSCRWVSTRLASRWKIRLRDSRSPTAGQRVDSAGPVLVQGIHWETAPWFTDPTVNSGSLDCRCLCKSLVMHLCHVCNVREYE